jgi:hypothetical protein
MKKLKGWVKHHLGYLQTELDLALVGLVEGLFVGLDLMPKGMQNEAVLLGHEGLGAGSDPGSDLVSVHVSSPGLEPFTFSVSLPLSVPNPKDEHRLGNLVVACPSVVGSYHVSSAIVCSSDLSSSSG